MILSACTGALRNDRISSIRFIRILRVAVKQSSSQAVKSQRIYPSHAPNEVGSLLRTITELVFVSGILLEPQSWVAEQIAPSVQFPVTTAAMREVMRGAAMARRAWRPSIGVDEMARRVSMAVRARCSVVK